MNAWIPWLRQARSARSVATFHSVAALGIAVYAAERALDRLVQRGSWFTAAHFSDGGAIPGFGLPFMVMALVALLGALGAPRRTWALVALVAHWVDAATSSGVSLTLTWVVIHLTLLALLSVPRSPCASESLSEVSSVGLSAFLACILVTYLSPSLWRVGEGAAAGLERLRLGFPLVAVLFTVPSRASAFVGLVIQVGVLSWWSAQTRQFGTAIVLASTGALFLDRTTGETERVRTGAGEMVLTIAAFLMVTSYASSLLGLRIVQASCAGALQGVGLLPVSSRPASLGATSSPPTE